MTGNHWHVSGSLQVRVCYHGQPEALRHCQYQCEPQASPSHGAAGTLPLALRLAVWEACQTAPPGLSLPRPGLPAPVASTAVPPQSHRAISLNAVSIRAPPSPPTTSTCPRSSGVCTRSNHVTRSFIRCTFSADHSLQRLIVPEKYRLKTHHSTCENKQLCRITTPGALPGCCDLIIRHQRHRVREFQDNCKSTEQRI